jgi:hypothetical protein
MTAEEELSQSEERKQVHVTRVQRAREGQGGKLRIGILASSQGEREGGRDERRERECAKTVTASWLFTWACDAPVLCLWVYTLCSSYHCQATLS